jgi:cold shock CspA family protein
VTELAHGTAHRGVVTAYDDAVGLGVVTTADGAEFAFHCIEIANGTRSIDVGTAVSFEPLAKLGRWEASAVRA